MTPLESIVIGLVDTSKKINEHAIKTSRAISMIHINKMVDASYLGEFGTEEELAELKEYMSPS